MCPTKRKLTSLNSRSIVIVSKEASEKMKTATKLSFGKGHERPIRSSRSEVCNKSMLRVRKRIPIEPGDMHKVLDLSSGRDIIDFGRNGHLAQWEQ